MKMTRLGRIIRTKYLAPTNYRGARIKATDGPDRSVVVSYPHELSGETAHFEAVKKLCEKYGYAWGNEWYVTSADGGLRIQLHGDARGWKMNKQELREKRKQIQGKYAWPGGYPLVAIMSDGEPMCPECVAKEWRIIYRATLDGYEKQWIMAGVEVNWEDTGMLCCHCGKRIESAYGESEE